jgi:hypothetical protein
VSRDTSLQGLQNSSSHSMFFAVNLQAKKSAAEVPQRVTAVNRVLLPMPTKL